MTATISIEQLKEKPQLCLSVMQNCALYSVESEVFQLATIYYKKGMY